MSKLDEGAALKVIIAVFALTLTDQVIAVTSIEALAAVNKIILFEFKLSLVIVNVVPDVSFLNLPEMELIVAVSDAVVFISF